MEAGGEAANTILIDHALQAVLLSVVIVSQVRVCVCVCVNGGMRFPFVSAVPIYRCRRR